MYYIVPAKFFNALKALAHADEDLPAGDGSTTLLDSLKTDLLELILVPEGEQHVLVARLDTMEPSGAVEFDTTTIWLVKSGLTEHEDFQFIAEAGWDLMRKWSVTVCFVGSY